MAKHKVDGCFTTIKRGPGCFIITTKLQLTDDEVKIAKNVNKFLPDEVYRKLHLYTRVKGERIVSKKSWR